MPFCASAVSANTPSVHVVAPNGGDSIGSSLNINWTGSDADGDVLTYTVLYNAPPLAVWYPLAANITQTSLTVDTLLLPGSDQARVKVLATDGVNTAEDESDTGFNVTKKGPLVGILYPPDGTFVPAGKALLMTGGAYDAEDGSLANTALSWSSDRDGALGQGSNLTVVLSNGWHTLTLHALDSNGQSSTAQVTVFVGSRVYLPLISRAQ